MNAQMRDMIRLLDWAPTLPPHVAADVVRLAASLRRWEARRCGNYGEVVEMDAAGRMWSVNPLTGSRRRIPNRGARLQAQIEAHLHPFGIGALFGGDPREAVVLLYRRADVVPSPSDPKLHLKTLAL